MEHPVLARVVEALRPVRGLVALVLGGSRARGTAGPASDYDLGLYYEPDAPLDVAALQAAIAPLVDEPSSTVTRLGEWGPWINGGGWLTIEGVEVDLLYRDLGRVREVITEARQGRFSMNYQPGHPHGFSSVIWMGEVATCRPLLDASGRIAELKNETSPFPEPLRDALIARFGWEVGFAIENAELAARRAEQMHIAGCAYRALSCVAQVLFALNGRYLINEKGALTEASTYPLTLEGLTRTQAEIWRDIGNADHASALRRLHAVSDALRALVEKAGSRWISSS
ncbi:nucleotidyltransferase domain-containing protein [Vitiosangium sp. GDMCC 1.1324]|uniref:nucleotidyltransferase domain-containing protein n=1 Tax=Vitiosangium sp. (strain GDMCC 1.1324) TaxID=2138576 RepID=UPI000D36F16B|nr:nucleotidyltransferase domain-containing protein [Vitiosangium sp. GDMCC 1.1324]PTL83409.1 DNA polymerase subunit beta [Vitiosangium sp. GDMCC 1.1324]